MPLMYSDSMTFSTPSEVVARPNGEHVRSQRIRDTLLCEVVVDEEVRVVTLTDRHDQVDPTGDVDESTVEPALLEFSNTLNQGRASQNRVGYNHFAGLSNLATGKLLGRTNTGQERVVDLVLLRVETTSFISPGSAWMNPTGSSWNASKVKSILSLA